MSNAIIVFPISLRSSATHLLALLVCKPFRDSIYTKHFTHSCPVFYTGGHDHRRIASFHSNHLVISLWEDAHVQYAESLTIVMVLNKLKSLQIHWSLPFINCKTWTKLLSWLLGFSQQISALGRTHPEHPIAVNRTAIDLDGDNTWHQ